MSEKMSLRAWRIDRGMTQQDVADMLGVKRQTVAAWESDDWTPNEVVIYALAKLYETEVDYIRV